MITTFNINVDAGAFSTHCAAVVKNVNEAMSQFGFHEKISLRIDIGTLSVTHFSEIDAEECRQKAEEVIREIAPSWDAKLIKESSNVMPNM